jgi:hypothetical protein
MLQEVLNSGGTKLMAEIKINLNNESNKAFYQPKHCL